MDYESARLLQSLVGLSFGLVLIPIVVALALYVLSSIAHMKGLKQLGYANAWMAWIPFGRWFALADCLQRDTDTPCGVSMPMSAFRFWWVIQLIVSCIPKVGPIASFVLLLLCLGWNYTAFYAALDGRSESDMAPLGYISAIISLVATIKLLCLPKKEG